MSLVVTCPGCSKSLGAPAAAAGKQGKCANCGTRIVFPPTPPPAAPEVFDPVAIEQTPRIVPTRTSFQRIEHTYRMQPENVFWSTVAFLAATVIFTVLVMILAAVVMLALGAGAAGLSSLAR